MVKNIVKDIIVEKGYYDCLKLSQKETKLLYEIIKQSLLKFVKELLAAAKHLDAFQIILCFI